jgi:nucleotidyltransferase substrate binding protein (TIGR01987 family)
VDIGKDIRSQQRFSNFKKAFRLYEEALAPNLKLSRLEEEGLIQRFEYCFELAWKTLQDLLQERGYESVRGPRPVIEQAFQDGIITTGPTWMEMLKARNDVAHLYDEATFLRISKQVKVSFFECLRTFRDTFKSK